MLRRAGLRIMEKVVHGGSKSNPFNVPTCIRCVSHATTCTSRSAAPESLSNRSCTIAIWIKDVREDRTTVAQLCGRMMATSPGNSIVTMPRVRVLCALTGELLYEPTHPWLEQIRIHLLKTWTWIKGRNDLPAAPVSLALLCSTAAS